ncbi:hypothetical protein V8B55DRAFT_1490625 [Mucor lusitanicus]
MDGSVIVIDDSDTEPPITPSNQQPNPSTSTSAGPFRKTSELRNRVARVRQPRSALSSFERKRKDHERSTHPLARRRASGISEGSGQRDSADDNHIPLNRQSIRIAKKKVVSIASKKVRQQRPRPSSYSLSSSDDDSKVEGLLKKHYSTMSAAKKNEARRLRLGLPASRLRIPTKYDPESAHREFFVKNAEAKKIEEDIKNGYIVRVEDRHAIQLDDLDPELLTGRPLTEKEAYWVAKKQARRAGPRSSSWPSIVPTHDQHTEYISLTSKARNMHLVPLSRPAESRPLTTVISLDAPLCVGCSRLFSCVKNRKEKVEMIDWIITGKTSDPIISPKDMDRNLMDLCRRRVSSMKVRAHEHYSRLPENFVTAQELYDSVKDDNYNCYLVGSPMKLQFESYNSLTFDHIFPISVAMMKPNCWSIENFQPMSYCMNQVKGNEANKEAKRWLINFKKHYYSSDFKA